MHIIIIIAIIVTIILYFITEQSVFYADKQDELKKRLKELANDKNETPKPRPQLSQTPKPRPLQALKPRPPETPRPLQAPKPRPLPPQPPRPLQAPKPRPPQRNTQNFGPIRGQLKQSYQPDVKNMVNSFIDNNDQGFKSNLNNFLSKNSTFKATQLTACNTNNPTLDDIICNLKFQYKIQSFI